MLIYLKLTIKTPEPCLLFLLLIYFLLYSTVIIAEFEEINAGWVWGYMISENIDLPQFSIIPNMFGNIPDNESNIYERDWSKFDRQFCSRLLFCRLGGFGKNW